MKYWLKFLIGSLLILSIALRLYHFPERINFGMEQGMQLSTTASYLYDKFTLLGMVNVHRVTQDGHMVLISPLYNYSLIPFMIAMGRNPITLTYLAFATNIVTSLALYYISKKLLGFRVALISTFFFLFNLTMIEQSLTLWIHNVIPLIGIMSLYLLVKWNSDKNWWVIFSLGILSGIGYSLEYVYLATLLGIGLYLLVTAKHKWQCIFWYFSGFLVPMLPVLAFDLRHDWYGLRTLWQYSLETLSNPGQSMLAFYHLLQFYPLCFLGMGYLTDRVLRIRPVLGSAFLLGYLIFILTSPKLSLNQAIGTVAGMDAPSLMKFSEAISRDAPDSYNVVYLPQSEYRAYALRYLLTYVHNAPPLGFDGYPSANVIYVVGQSDLDLLTSNVWEINSFQPSHQIVLASTPNNLYSVYKLTR